MLSSGVREILADGRGGDRRRDPRRRPDQARRAPGADPGAARRQHGPDAAGTGRQAIQRIGLSATQRPLERIAKFLVGPKRDCEIVDAGPQEGPRPRDRRPGRRHGRPRRARLPLRGRRPAPSEIEPCAHVRSIWPAIYPELLELVQEHTSTIIFVNNRRAAERLAKRLNELANGEGESELPTRADGHGEARRELVRQSARASRDRPCPPRLALPRGAHSGRGAAQVRPAALPGRHLARSSSASTWAPSTS